MAEQKFSLQKFSANQSSSDLSIEVSLYSELQGSAGPATQIHIDSLIATAVFSGYVGMAVAIPFEAEISTEFKGHSTAKSAIGIDADCACHLNGEASLGARIGVEADLQSEIKGKSSLGARIYCGFDWKADLNGSAEAGSQIHEDYFVTAMLLGTSELAEMEEQAFVVDVELPPGAELRVDSENYTVTLDGENILYLQEGDWLRLSRGLRSILVDSGSGGSLEGEVIYQERWL